MLFQAFYTNFQKKKVQKPYRLQMLEKFERPERLERMERRGYQERLEVEELGGRPFQPV